MNTAELSKAVATTNEPKSLQKLIQESVKELGRALPSHLSPERMARIALTCIRLNPELSKCTPESFLGSLFVLAQVGLEPIAGRSYLLPFNNKRKIGGEWKTVKEVQAVLGYKGLIELFYRHESALSIDMQAVYSNDDFAYQYGTESFLRHTPALKNRGEVIGYYAVAKIKGGGTVFYFLSKEDAVAHGQKHSKTFDKEKKEFYSSSPWAKEFDAMAQKTAIIQLAKKLPLSVELQRALTIDETSRNYKSGIDDALDITPTTSWDDPEEKAVPETTTEAKAETPKDSKTNRVTFELDHTQAGDLDGSPVWIIYTKDKAKIYTDDESLASQVTGFGKKGLRISAGVFKDGGNIWAKDVTAA